MFSGSCTLLLRVPDSNSIGEGYSDIWRGDIAYPIHGIIGKSNIWQFTLKMQLARFLMSTVWKETHAYSLNGEHLIWQYLHDFPYHQIYHIHGITF